MFIFRNSITQDNNAGEQKTIILPSGQNNLIKLIVHKSSVYDFILLRVVFSYTYNITIFVYEGEVFVNYQFRMQTIFKVCLLRFYCVSLLKFSILYFCTHYDVKVFRLYFNKSLPESNHVIITKRYDRHFDCDLHP